MLGNTSCPKLVPYPVHLIMKLRVTVSLLTRLVIFLLLLPPSTMSAQNAVYNEWKRKAEQLYMTGDFLASARAYDQAFAALDGKGLLDDRYNAACSWSLAGRPDSAFYHLFRLAEKANYTNLGHLTTDPDLQPIHQDERWQQLISRVEANKKAAEAKLDPVLAPMLDSVFQQDQAGRQMIAEVERRYGAGSKQMDSLWRSIQFHDSVNQEKVIAVLETRGWLGSDLVGAEGSQALFLVIQHADLPVQEKYLPMMREAVRAGKASGSSLALLEDRVALRKGGRQRYGSQIGLDPETGEKYLSPLEDPDQVDQRRAEVGLGPLSDYLLNFGLVWDVEEYKKQLPALEKRLGTIK